MNPLSINPRLRLRKALPWLLCFLFLCSSGGFAALLESSGINVRSRVRASADAQSVQGANESGCTNADFTAAGSSPEAVGTLPISVAVGDFNLDGKPDLATANTTSSNITILLGNGMGDFSPASTSPEATSSGPLQIVVSDFNLDGKPDLASISAANNNMTILLGNGMGDFSPSEASPISVDEGPTAVAVGDFNLDGKPDLATANANQNNVTVVLGDGEGGFHFSVLASVGFNPQSLTVGDFNLDGRPDLAVANSSGSNVTILLGNGEGDFSPASTSPEAVGIQPFSVAVGDFNLDGKPDLATANGGSDSVTILLGDGTGNFNPAPASPEVVGTRPQSVAVGDFNLDGRPDLATANNASNNVTILLNTCTARPCPTNFTPPATSPETVGTQPQAVAVGDFNLDGRPDLSIPNSQSAGNVTILFGDGTGNFNPAATSPEAVGAFPESVAVGDFNLDGKPDLVTGNHGSDTVTILLGDGTGNF